MDRRAERFGGDPLADERRRMIRQTEAFLTWALRHGEVPRIPARPVREGGFAFLRGEPRARALVAGWWRRVLSDDAPVGRAANWGLDRLGRWFGRN